MSEPNIILKKIVKRVLLVHLILLLCFSISFKSKKKKSNYTRVALRENVRRIENKPIIKKKVIAAAAKAPSKKTVTAPAKKVAAKPKVAVASKKSLPKIKIEEPPKLKPKEEVVIDLPKAIAELKSMQITQEELQDFDSPGRYAETLQSLMKQTLHINPGKFIELELTLDKYGKVKNIEHIKSSDLLTKEQALKKVSQMEFPNFFGEIARESEYTFVLKIQPREI